MSSFRRDYITKPIFSWARGVLPSMSDTEREALEAGDVWWDADLFTGNPDWSKLLTQKPATLTEEEAAFLKGPVDELCEMLDEWKINWEWRDLPPSLRARTGHRELAPGPGEADRPRPRFRPAAQ